MDRPIVFGLEGLRSADFLGLARAAMVGHAKLAAALLGSSTIVNGLACTPGSGLHVSLAAGEIYSPVEVDATDYGTLDPDSHTVLKQGILADAVALSVPAPGTGGQSINYLVEVQFQENDVNSTSLPFYDASNPAVPLYNAGDTLRQDVCAVQVKAGTAATTGTQTTPSADAGWTGLWVVTVAHGDASISSGQIVELNGAPFLTNTLPGLLAALPTNVQAGVQNQSWVYAGAAGGTANALTASLSPASTSLVAGMAIELKITAENTSGATLNLDGHGTKTITTADGDALVGGEMSVGMIARLRYDGTNFQLAELSPKFIAGTLLSSSRAVNPTAGRYYAPSHVDADSSVSTSSVIMYFVPITREITIDAVAFVEATSSTSGSARVGIYNSDSNGLPDTLIDELGVITLTGVATTAHDGVLGASHSVNGLTWLGMLVDPGVSPPAFTNWVGNAEAKAIFGSGAADLSTLECGLQTTSVTFGALPANAPSGLTLTNSVPAMSGRSA